MNVFDVGYKGLPIGDMDYAIYDELLLIIRLGNKEGRSFYEMERSGIEPLTSTMPSLRSTN